MAERQFTGKHALAIFVAAFAVIISVNVILAYNAVKTFPGLVVKNSYVASQEFNSRLQGQQALGWITDVEAKGGLVIIRIADQQGNPVRVDDLQVVIGRPTHVRDDFAPEFTYDGLAYVAVAELNPGNWNVRVAAKDQSGSAYSQSIGLYVKG
ncbi:MAG: FixH family protein [Ruegeria sp.]